MNAGHVTASSPWGWVFSAAEHPLAGVAVPVARTMQL
jgi:hypothetical protein